MAGGVGGHHGRVIRFAKGHGTGNDFVIVDDADNARPLTPHQIAALCDRRTGIGGDGLLRVVRAAKHPDGVGQAGEAEWFMDYYNADGSVAEMCGNGVRVFVAHLRAAGLVDDSVLPVATRAGMRTVVTEGAVHRVDMGPARIGPAAVAELDGVTHSGVAVSMGNPHLVCRVPDPDLLDLTRAPRVDPALFTDGVNVEFVADVVGAKATGSGPEKHSGLSGRVGHIRMRVHERGVGETLSCGTGACATAAVALGGPGVCEVDVPGGRLTVTVTDTTTLLAGPAVLVATGETDLV